MPMMNRRFPLHPKNENPATMEHSRLEDSSRIQRQFQMETLRSSETERMQICPGFANTRGTE
jgi:hypothetical protein